MQSTWLALAVGAVVLAVGQLVPGPVSRALAGGPGPVADAALAWLRVALLGAPLVLVTLAGNGLCAVLCPVLVYGPGPAPALGLVGSAVANVTAQAVAAALFVRALLVERVPLAPMPALLREQLGMGATWCWGAGFQACFLSAAAVAARFGAASVGAHQIVPQPWNFQAMVLDALAIAAVPGAAQAEPTG